jgi:hypothetical protein
MTSSSLAAPGTDPLYEIAVEAVAMAMIGSHWSNLAHCSRGDRELDMSS